MCDDEPNLTEMIGAVLRKASYDVRTTTDVREVLQLARAFKPHVALLGVVMPHVGGVQLSTEIFSIRPDTKFVLITEWVDEAILRELRGKGLACAALLAPFPRGELLALIAKLTD